MARQSVALRARIHLLAPSDHNLLLAVAQATSLEAWALTEDAVGGPDCRDKGGDEAAEAHEGVDTVEVLVPDEQDEAVTEAFQI